MKPDPGQWEWQIGNQQLSRNHYYFLSKVEKCNYEKSDAILDPDILSSQLGQFLKIHCSIPKTEATHSSKMSLSVMRILVYGVKTMYTTI
jgi:hypothetical protein